MRNAYRNGGVHRIARPCESDGTVGIGESTGNATISVYPNPASNVLHIQASHLHKVELMDMSGRLITSTDHHQLDISHLPAGAYCRHLLVCTFGEQLHYATAGLRH